MGIVGACEGIKELFDRLRNRLGSIWPGLEAKPEILSITDPANLESDNPAVSSAAAVKAEEDAAAQKAKAIAYLASVGCAGCYPGIEDALLAALDDCTELVRFETAKALSDVVRSAAARATAADVKADAKEFIDEFTQRQKRWDAVRRAEQAAAANPDDPAANLALGLYHMFDRGDQAKGL